MEAISHAGTSLGILASDGVVLAAEKKVSSKLLESLRSSEKIYLLNEYVLRNSSRPSRPPPSSLTFPRFCLYAGTWRRAWPASRPTPTS